MLVGIALVVTPLWLQLQFPGYLKHLFHAIPGEVWGNPTAIGGEGHYYGGDQVQILYLSWKLKQNLREHWSILTDHLTFAARTGVHHDLCIGPQFWLIAFLSLFVGDVAAYNLGFVVLPLVFSFLAGYYLFGAATSSPWVRALLAAGVSVLPLRVVEMMMGHSTGSFIWAVLLYWGVVLHHHLKRGPRHGDAIAGAILLATVIAEEHQGLYLLITSAMVFSVWGIQALWPLRGAHRAVGRLLWRWKYLLAGVALVGAWGLFYRKMLLVDSVGHDRFERPAWDIKLYSQPLRNFLDLDSESNIGAWLARALPIGALGLLVAERGRLWRFARSPFLPFALALPVLLFLTVGLGPDWSQRTGIYEWFYDHVPFFAAQRVSIKMFTVSGIFIGILSAASYESLAGAMIVAQREQRRRSRIIVGIATSLVLAAIALQPLQYARNIARRWPGLLLTDLNSGPSHIFFYLRTHLSRRDIVLTVPFDVKKSRWETYPDFLAFRAHVRFADGYFGMHPHYFEAAARDIATFNDGAPSTIARAAAKNLGYTYLLLNKDQWPLRTPPAVVQAHFDGADWLDRIMCDGDFCLYALK